MTRLEIALVAAGLVGVVGCTPVAVSPSPAPARPGLDWAQAPTVERPAGMDAEPPSIPPVGSGGGLGHPGHFSGQGHVLDVVDTGAALVAVGYVIPDFRAAAWTSTDGSTWRIVQGLDGGGEATFLNAAAVAPGGGIVAVGRDGSNAAAWRSDDGSTWERSPAVPSFREAPELRLTAVATGGDALVAAGWTGLVTEPGEARFWRSTDGAEWRPSAVHGDDEGRPSAIAVGPGGWITVGPTGPPGTPTGSAIWRSTDDGETWARLDDQPALTDGVMASVTAGGPGFVAVGAEVAGRRAMAWTSPDGEAWSVVPEQEAFTFYDQRIHMTDVTAGPQGLVAVGDYLFGTQFGAGAAWRSTDGLTWTRAPAVAALEQGRLAGVIARGEAYVAVGTYGAPDNYVPTVWLSPPP